MPNAQERDEWSHAPFDAAAKERLRSLFAGFDVSQRLWLSGYLAGSCAPMDAAAAHPVSGAARREAITILYGSQSGNSERIARLLQDKLKERQIEATLLDMIDCRKSHLQAAQKLIVIVSTHGDGDPPERALALHELLHGPKISRLDHLSYCVLALGDSSYEKFCETGPPIRCFAGWKRSARSGCRAREECDVEYEMPARRWLDEVLTLVGSQAAAGTSPRIADSESRAATVSTAYHPPQSVSSRGSRQPAGFDRNGRSSKDVRGTSSCRWKARTFTL